MAHDQLQQNLARWFKARDLKPSSVFLVGGAVRDLMLKRPSGDLDLACRNADNFSRRLADANNASIVRFEKKPGKACYRVVDRENPNNFLDLVELREGDITIDLARRDFTINAMAMPVYARGRLGDLVDPHRGLSDLKGKIVRMVASEAFVDDPLRVLRAWRFAAELGFRIDMTTRKHVKEQAQRLKTVAEERIVYELFRILGVQNAGHFFREMAGATVLDVVFPEKGGGHKDSARPIVWNNALAVMDRLETILGSRARYFDDAGDRVIENLGSGNRLPLLKLAALFSDIGQAGGGMVEHMAEKVARRLKISNRDRSFFQCVLTGLSDVFAIAAGGNDRSRLIGFFKARADDGVGALVLGIAVLSADPVGVHAGIERRPGSQSLSKAIFEYYSGIRAKLAEKALIVGQDLIDDGLSPGPRLGAVLREVRRAQDEGVVTSRSEALEWAHQFLSPQD